MIKKVLVVLACFLIVLSLAIRELPIGSDSAYYLGQACKTTPQIGAPLDFLFSFYPCNLLFVKVLMLSLALFIAIGLYQTAKLLFPNQKENWLILLFCFGTTFFPQFLLQFENDQVGFLIGLAATVLFLQAVTIPEKDWWKTIMAFCLMVPAILAWKMTALFFLVWIFFDFGVLTVLAGAMTLVMLFPTIASNEMVWENIPWLGFLELGISVFLIWSVKLTKKIVVPFVFFVCLSIVNAQFWVFAAWLAGYMVLGSYYQTKKIQWVFLFLAASFAVMLFFSSLSQYPSNQEVGLTQRAVSFSKDLNVDFGQSWLVYYEGGKPDVLGYPIKDDNVFEKRGYVLTYATGMPAPCNIIESDCLKQHPADLCGIEKSLKIWKCF